MERPQPAPLERVRTEARRIGVAEKRLRRAIRERELTAYLLGRWLWLRPNDTDEWLERQRFEP